MYLCPYSKWKYPSKTHTHGIRKQKTSGCADQLSTTRQTWQYRNISTQRGQNNDRLLKRRKNIRTMAANHLGAHGRVLEAKRKRRMKQYTGSLWTADGEKKLETKTVLLWRHESIQSCSSSRMGGARQIWRCEGEKETNAMSSRTDSRDKDSDFQRQTAGSTIDKGHGNK